MGLPPDLKVIADGMIKASMHMVDTVMVGARDTAIALFHELGRQHGLEKGIKTDWRMPATGDRSRIAEELKHHLGVVGT
ncbi:hypothetical protein ACIRU5_05900 [Streptomyces misionensis]|uniref:hypothetical protein n=1 Tax=Streptomyces misionensis TaxID=67331 RepID=UPI0037F73C6A